MPKITKSYIALIVEGDDVGAVVASLLSSGGPRTMYAQQIDAVDPHRLVSNLLRVVEPDPDTVDVSLTGAGPQRQEMVALLHEMFGPIWDDPDDGDADETAASRLVCERELDGASEREPFVVATGVSRSEAEAQAAKLRALGATVRVAP